MTDRIPVKAVLSSGDAVGLAEFAAGDTTPVVHGGTGVTTLSELRTALDVPSNSEVMHSGYMHIQDQRASGTAGGPSVAGANTRTLNPVVSNTISGASLASNVITLPVGSYRFSAECMCVADTAASHVTSYLQNTSDSVKALIGTRAYVAVGTANTSLVKGRFTIAATKTFTLVTQFTAANSAGLGLAAAFGYAEVYSNVEIWKE